MSTPPPTSWISAFLAIPELILHTLHQFPPSKFSDDSVKTLVCCSLVSRALRDVVKTESLWKWHYIARYGVPRGAGNGLNDAPLWYTLYIHRRRVGDTTLHHLSRIISTPSDRADAITALIDLGEDVKDELRMEAGCRAPKEVEDLWAAEDEWKWDDEVEWEEDDQRGIGEDWIERRWWAKQALGTIYRVGGVNTLTSLFLGDRVKPHPTDVGNAVLFEEGLIALSSFMGVDVSRIPSYLDSLAVACKCKLGSDGICTDPQRDEFHLEAFSRGVCEWMQSQSFKKAPDGPQYYHLMNHFPHKFLTTHRRSLPMSLVCVFVSIVRRMGLRAAPVGFPGNVHAWIGLPSPSATTEFGETSQGTNTPARELHVDVFHADEEPFLNEATMRKTLGDLGMPRAGHTEMLRPSSAGDMVYRAANNILHSVTRIPHFTDGTITHESRGAALYAAAMPMLLARPDAGDSDRYISGITSVIKTLFPLDATPVLSHLINDTFPTGSLHTQLSDALKEIEEDEEPGPAKDRAKEGVEWWIGMMFRHKKYEYVGLVLGWDGECKASEGWIQAVGVDELPRGRRQPFYKVVTDGGQSMYVAEENILLLPIIRGNDIESQTLDWATVRRLMANASDTIAQTFARVEVDQSSGRAWFVPGVTKQLEYPDDFALGRAYMRGE